MAGPVWAVKPDTVWGECHYLKRGRKTLMSVWWVSRRGWRACLNVHPGGIQHEWLDDIAQGDVAGARAAAIARLEELCLELERECAAARKAVRK